MVQRLSELQSQLFPLKETRLVSGVTTELCYLKNSNVFFVFLFFFNIHIFSFVFICSQTTSDTWTRLSRVETLLLSGIDFLK